MPDAHTFTPAGPPGEVVEAYEIKDLRRGGSGYTLPWAFLRDEDGQLFVRGDFPIASTPGGNRRHPLRKDWSGQLFTTEQPRSRSSRLIDHAVRHWAAQPVTVVEKTENHEDGRESR